MKHVLVVFLFINTEIHRRAHTHRLDKMNEWMNEVAEKPIQANQRNNVRIMSEKWTKLIIGFVPLMIWGYVFFQLKIRLKTFQRYSKSEAFVNEENQQKLQQFFFYLLFLFCFLDSALAKIVRKFVGLCYRFNLLLLVFGFFKFGSFLLPPISPGSCAFRSLLQFCFIVFVLF